MQSISRESTPTVQRSKTPDLDNYLTPEYIRERMRQQKQWAKRLSVLAGEAELRGQIGETFDKRGEEKAMPLAVVRLIENGIKYNIDEIKNDDHPELVVSFLVRSSEATSFVQKWAKRYLEAVVMFGGVWFLITSVDVFWHKRSWDDCADGFQTSVANHPYALIRTKNQFGRYYCELSILIGDIELLAVGGFHGNDTSCSHHTFLGSSIGDLPQEVKQGKSSTGIFTRDSPCQYSVSNRHIRQYLKRSALNPWSFHSKRFLDKDFYPVNPLALADREDMVPPKNRIFNVMSSLYLTCAAKQQIVKQDLESMLDLALQHKSFKNCPTLDTFAACCEHLQQSGDKSSYIFLVMLSMAFLEANADAETFGRDREKTLKMKRRSLDLLNKGLAACLKSVNTALVKKFEKDKHF